MFAWRFGFFVTSLGAMASWLVMLFFWSAVYGEGNQIGSFTLEQLMLYYTFSVLFQIILETSFIWDIASAIHSGNVTEYLLKPISYLKFKMVSECGAHTVMLIGFSLPFAIAVFYFRDQMPHTLSPWLWAFGTAGVGFLLVSLIGFLFAMATVWFRHQYVAVSLFFSISLLLSGRTIPIAIMPEWLRTIAEWTPFPLVAGTPIELLMGTRHGLTLHEVLFFATWLIVLLFAATWAWRRAAIYYEASGT